MHGQPRVADGGEQLMITTLDLAIPSQLTLALVPDLS